MAYLVVTGASIANLMGLVAAVALLMIAVWARVFALRVQDRVIRLEMHLRVAHLARKVLADRIDDRTAIKRMIRDWQADLVRA